MPLNLIGLLRASRAGAAPGQGFKNYAAGTPVTGTAMSDYLFGTPTSLQTIQSVSQRVGTLTVANTTYTLGTPIPAFTNVTIVAQFAKGAKLASIYDAAYVLSDTTNQVLVENVSTDGGSVQSGFQYVTVRSVDVNLSTNQVTAIVTMNNSDSYTGSLPAAGSGGYKNITLRLGVQPEPWFNLRAYTAGPNLTGGVPTIVVKPYRAGQPTPSTFSTIGVQTPTTSQSTFTASDYISAQWGDHYYTADLPGNVNTNYFLSGYRLRPILFGGWWSDFNTDYASYGLQLRYRWFRKVNGDWVQQNETIATSATQSPVAYYAVNWNYPSGSSSGPSPALIETRFTAQVIAPFTSPIATVDYSVIPPDYTLTSGSGGPPS